MIGLTVATFAVDPDIVPFADALDWLDPIRSQIESQVTMPLLMFATTVLFAMDIVRWLHAFHSIPWLTSLDVKSDIVPWPHAEQKSVATPDLFKHTGIQEMSTPEIAC